MAPWLPNGKDGGTELAELVFKHFYDIERVSLLHDPHPQRSPCHRFRLVTLMLTKRIDIEGVEPSCDTIFFLAYGALLLSHTNLKLYRGRRYG
jgi:hypothetical protein